MAYSHQEAAVTVAKEIMLGLIANGKNYLLNKDNEPIGGTELSAHVGDCFEALLKKVMHAVQEI